LRPARLITLLVGMVVLPVGALAVVGWRLVEDGAALVARQADELAAAELQTVAARIGARLAERERDALQALAALPAGSDADATRAWRAGHPALSAPLVVDRDGTRRFPPAVGPLTEAEQRLLEETRPLWQEGGLLDLARGAGAAESGAAPAYGWYAWFHERDVRLLLWQADPERVVGLVLSRVQLLADVVGALPETDDEAPGPLHQTALLDAHGRTVYAWGAWRPPDGERPRATLALAAPLSAWRLERRTPPAAVPAALTVGVGAGIGALALVLVLAAVWLYRERTREMRLAAQRVGFVGQVSHELRTPLTNIRLYAELLADGCDPDGDDLDRERVRQLGVVVEETRRLERLIDNVLDFARTQQGRLRLQPQPGRVDDAVRRALDAMGPTLRARGIEPELDLAAPAEVPLDPDAVEQILTNLLGNVAKYAADGRWVGVTSRQGNGATTVRVADRGPGVPAAHRERIFEPFHRVSDRLSDGTSGTGIGLDIARRLARLHGGDLRLVAAERGACFEVVLGAPAAVAPPAPPAPPPGTREVLTRVEPGMPTTLEREERAKSAVEEGLGERLDPAVWSGETTQDTQEVVPHEQA
jgi:signal transduction histidine kinase